MGILSNIFRKIFPGSHPAVTQPAPPSGSQQSAAQQSASQQSASVATPAPPVDVEAILSNMAAQAGQPLNWRTSIVDLLKLLNLDSSLAARQALAVELHYVGDRNDSGTMNIWLHRQVMIKLAENGGKVPAELKN